MVSKSVLFPFTPKKRISHAGYRAFREEERLYMDERSLDTWAGEISLIGSLGRRYEYLYSSGDNYIMLLGRSNRRHPFSRCNFAGRQEDNHSPAFTGSHHRDIRRDRTKDSRILNE